MHYKRGVSKRYCSPGEIIVHINRLRVQGFEAPDAALPHRASLVCDPLVPDRFW